jgi:hypothetical protein
MDRFASCGKNHWVLNSEVLARNSRLLDVTLSTKRANDIREVRVQGNGPPTTSRYHVHSNRTDTCPFFSPPSSR